MLGLGLYRCVPRGTSLEDEGLLRQPRVVSRGTAGWLSVLGATTLVLSKYFLWRSSMFYRTLFCLYSRKDVEHHEKLPFVIHF